MKMRLKIVPGILSLLVSILLVVFWIHSFLTYMPTFLNHPWICFFISLLVIVPLLVKFGLSWTSDGIKSFIFHHNAKKRAEQERQYEALPRHSYHNLPLLYFDGPDYEQISAAIDREDNTLTLYRSSDTCILKLKRLCYEWTDDVFGYQLAKGDVLFREDNPTMFQVMEHAKEEFIRSFPDRSSLQYRIDGPKPPYGLILHYLTESEEMLHIVFGPGSATLNKFHSDITNWVSVPTAASMTTLEL